MANGYISQLLMFLGDGDVYILLVRVWSVLYA